MRLCLSRLSLSLCALVMLNACVSQAVAPRSYLDEETAVTITIVAEPWIFTDKHFTYSAKDRNYLKLFAVDVNRMGEHRQYLAMLVSGIPRSLLEAETVTLDLDGGGQHLSLQPTTDDLRQLGISKPLAPTFSMTARWWYFPVGKDILATVVRSKDLKVVLVAAERRIEYAAWRDGSAETAELTTVLP